MKIPMVKSFLPCMMLAIACQVFSAPAFGAEFSQRADALSMKASTGASLGSFWALWTNGTLVSEFDVPADGMYTVWTRAFESAAGDSPAKMAIVVDGLIRDGAISVSATAANPQMYARQVRLLAGRHSIGIAFVNDFFAPPLDRNLFVEYVQVSAADKSACGPNSSGVFTSAVVSSPKKNFTTGFPGSTMTPTSGTGAAVGTAWSFGSNGTLESDVTIPAAGSYTLSARAYENAGGSENARMYFLVDGLEYGPVLNVSARVNAPQLYSQAVTLSAGVHRVGVKFINDYSSAPIHRSLVIENMSVFSVDPTTTSIGCGESELVTMALSDCKMVADQDVAPNFQRLNGNMMSGTTGNSFGDGWIFWTNGRLTSVFNVPVAGRYRLSAQAFQQAGGPTPAKMAFLRNGRTLSSVFVTGTSNSPQVYSTEVNLRAGKQRLGVAFTNDYSAPGADRNLFIKFVELTPVNPFLPVVKSWPTQPPNATVAITVNPGLSIGASRASEGTIALAGQTISWLIGPLKEQTATLNYEVKNADCLAKQIPILDRVTYDNGQVQPLPFSVLTADLKGAVPPVPPVPPVPAVPGVPTIPTSPYCPGCPIDLMVSFIFEGSRLSSGNLLALKNGASNLVSNVSASARVAAITFQNVPCLQSSITGSYDDYGSPPDFSLVGPSISWCTYYQKPYFFGIPFSLLTVNRSGVAGQLMKSITYQNGSQSGYLPRPIDWNIHLPFLTNSLVGWSLFERMLPNRQPILIHFIESRAQFDLHMSSTVDMRKRYPGLIVITIGYGDTFDMTVPADYQKAHPMDFQYYGNSPSEFDAIFTDIAKRLGR